MIQKTERFEMRMDLALAERIDSWREQQRNSPTRAEGVRQLLEFGLAATNSARIQMSQSERLITWMLSDLLLLQKNYEDKESMKLVQQAILGGHLWALEWHFTGILHGHTDSEAALKFVLDVMNMWRLIEMSFAKLDASKNAKVRAEIRRMSIKRKFAGFDGNSEGEYRSIAKFLVDNMGRFDEFRDRTLNSHAPKLEKYTRMLEAYSKSGADELGRVLSIDELVEILNS